MAAHPDHTEILSAAGEWRDNCLLNDGSLFSDRKLWSAANIAELDRFYVQNLDMGAGTFFSKFEGQVQSASPEAKQLAAEMLWILYLFPNNIGRETKIAQVKMVWEWSGESFPEDSPILKRMHGGIGSGGPGYNNHRWSELVFLITLMGRWKALPAETQAANIADPWSFGSWLDTVQGADKRQFRHMLLHLLFPESYERVSSTTGRQQIDRAFTKLLSTDELRAANAESSPQLALDRRLLLMRERLEKIHPNVRVDFYESPVKEGWQKEIVDETVSIQEGLETILAEYRRARNAEFSGQHPVARVFAEVAESLRQSNAVKARSHIRVVPSVGKGNWSAVPWIALLDERETKTTMEGVYCVFLFRQDLSGVYLTFNQGVTKPLQKLGSAEGRSLLRQRAAELREQSGHLRETGFSLDDKVDLRVEAGLGSKYEASTIAYKLYQAGQVPSDEIIQRDLEPLLEAYSQYVERQELKPPTVARTWIFQCNPHVFDLPGALGALRELTWLVRQRRDEIQAGDKVYLWESGPNAGIVGTAATMSAPGLINQLPEEERYVLDNAKLGGQLLRVRLRVLSVLPRRFLRRELQEVPELSDLSILRAPEGTNFQVTTEEAEVLERLLEEPVVLESRLDLQAIHRSFSDSLRRSGVAFGARHDEVTRSFLASLATKGFVILTGLSGSGKTQIAMKFGEWLGVDRFAVIPVRPDWTGAESLFGYEDALQPALDGRRAWQVPEALRFMLRAVHDPNRAYLLVLDEMNLAHVERYFADALSGMESGTECLPNVMLGPDGQWRQSSSGPARVRMPGNLFIVGTVNVDETTYMFSPKVLDRANTIEFRVDTGDLLDQARKPVAADAGAPELVRGFLEISRDSAWQADKPASNAELFGRLLRSVHRVLSEGGFEFGHRVFYEAFRFAAMLEAAGVSEPDHALDLQILQKVLPRLHGSRRKLEPTLTALGFFCFDYTVDERPSTELTSQFNAIVGSVEKAKLPLSLAKIGRMMKNLRANQFTSFTE